MAGMMYMALTMAHGMSAGELVAYVTMVGLLPRPLETVERVGAQIQRGIVAAEDVFRLIDEPCEIDNGTHEVERAQGGMSIKHLTFRYPMGIGMCCKTSTSKSNQEKWWLLSVSPVAANRRW